MLNQSFSVENFRKILDLENRKGNFVEKDFFPEVKEVTEKIKECNRKIKTNRKNKTLLATLYQEKKELKKDKEEKLIKELQKISESVIKQSFKVELVKKPIPRKKTLYIAKNTPEHYLIMKQIQRNVSRLFKVKPASRFEIVNQVKTLLGDGFPKYVIRTDINEFYESIPREKLLGVIKGNNLLSPFSRKILRQILDKYTTLSGFKNGIPRGVGVSAYLAELYMRDVDKDIMALKNVSYYARYVDDIIIIFTPSLANHNRDYFKEVEEILTDKHHLDMKSQKTFKYDLESARNSYSMEYLGYKYFFGNGTIKTKLTTNKVKKYKKRIELAIDNFLNLKKIDSKEAKRILVKRVRFITGNTRLRNNKKNVLIGIYYSNCQLTELNDLIGLDRYLQAKINNNMITNN